MTLGPGTMLSHYRLVEKIGEGGMGVVYRARDETLDRDVALKVLPPGALADAATRRRFRKEALSLSRLNHPNIETVHAFDAHGGVDYLVMEFIPGVTLDEKLAAGPLPENEVAHLGTQLADGLAAAHAQGVVHHDLKPGNLRLTTDGRLKILDFGLAKWLQPAVDLKTTDKLSDTGSGAGTLPYMAPEQLKKDEVDPRSDIYAAGAVLYEMATGRRPFPQTSPPRLIEAILNQTPPNPGALNPLISPALESIVVKAMDKTPERRYQTARELQVDLERLGASVTTQARRRSGWPRRSRALALAGGLTVLVASALITFNFRRMREHLLGLVGSVRIDSIAVLPLTNLSGDSEQEYLADGITEDLITTLAQIGKLKVISRTSVMQYKDARAPLSAIARQLNVGAVVEGSVRRSGGRVRVTAQLIDAATDRHLWAKTYDRDVGDIIALESEIAQAISDGISLKLTPEERNRIQRASSVNHVALEAYLKGQYSHSKLTEDGLKRAIQYFDQAIVAEPGWAPPYAGLSRAYATLVELEFLSPNETYPKARAAAEKAIELDETVAEAHYALAMAMYDYYWDWPRSGKEVKRALELNPSYAPAWRLYAYWLETLGRHAEALEAVKSAQTLDPIPIYPKIVLAYLLFTSRRYDNAIEQLKEVLDIDPSSTMAHNGLARCYALKGMSKEAIAEAREAIALSGGSTETLATLGNVYALAGMQEEAQKVLATLADLSKRKYVSAVGVAMIYAGQGDTERAFESLEEAYSNRDPWISDLKVHPSLDPLRSDPRFTNLVRRIGLPPD